MILLIRSSSGILADNGMLCNGGYCSYDTAACPLCGILKFDQGVFICTIAVYAHQDGFCAVSFHHAQALHYCSRYPASIRGHSDHHDIFWGKGKATQIRLAVCQIDWENFAGPFPCQHIGDFLVPPVGLNVIS